MQTKDLHSEAVDQPSLPTLLGGSHNSTSARGASKVRDRAVSPCIFREMTGEVRGTDAYSVGIARADATDLDGASLISLGLALR
jgi:hypothetical protein